MNIEDLNIILKAAKVFKHVTPEILIQICAKYQNELQDLFNLREKFLALPLKNKVQPSKHFMSYLTEEEHEEYLVRKNNNGETRTTEIANGFIYSDGEDYDNFFVFTFNVPPGTEKVKIDVKQYRHEREWTAYAVSKPTPEEQMANQNRIAEIEWIATERMKAALAEHENMRLQIAWRRALNDEYQKKCMELGDTLRVEFNLGD